MTKAEIVDAIYSQTGIEHGDILKVVEGYMEVVKNSLQKGENVYLRSFGTFGLKTRKQKIARNISKGTAVIVPEHQIPYFKPCKEFMAAVAKK